MEIFHSSVKIEDHTSYYKYDKYSLSHDIQLLFRHRRSVDSVAITNRRKVNACKVTPFARSPFSSRTVLLLEVYKNSQSKIDLCSESVSGRPSVFVGTRSPYITWGIGRRYFLISNARPWEKNVGVTSYEKEKKKEEREREKREDA